MKEDLCEIWHRGRDPRSHEGKSIIRTEEGDQVSKQGEGRVHRCDGGIHRGHRGREDSAGVGGRREVHDELIRRSTYLCSLCACRL